MMIEMFIIGVVVLLLSGCLGKGKDPPSLDELYPIIMDHEFRDEFGSNNQIEIEEINEEYEGDCE